MLKGAVFQMTAGENSTKGNVIINSVDRTLDILEYLFKKDTDVSISQISKDLDIYKSTVFRTLATLENRGYVVQDSASELYTLGPKIFSYASNKKSNILARSIEPYLRRLNDKFLDTVSLSTLVRDSRGVYLLNTIANVESQHNLSVHFSGTMQSECYCSSMGKCLLAFNSNLDLSVYKRIPLEKFTENTIADYDQLLKELDRIRSQGYAFDDEEREIGLFCLGVPIMSGGKAVAAMSLSGPASRIREDHLEEKIAYMKELSAEISDKVLL